jgi:hypothetical protein
MMKGIPSIARAPTRPPPPCSAHFDNEWDIPIGASRSWIARAAGGYVGDVTGDPLLFDEIPV